MTSSRIIAGPRDAVPPPGAISTLAIRLRDHAQSLGLVVSAVNASRCASSASRYLTIVDGRGRSWLIRVSNHFRPRRTGHHEPHLDFISKDGAAGYDRAADFLSRVAAGDAAWWPARRLAKPKGRR